MTVSSATPGDGLMKLKVGCALILAALSQRAIAREITIATGDYPPGYSEYIQHNGYTLHILKEAFAAVDIDVKFRFLPWKRAYKWAKEGKYPATCCWFNSSQREQDFYRSEPLHNEGFWFFHMKNFEFAWNELPDLKGIPIAATRGYTFGDGFMTAAENGTVGVDWVQKDELALKMLVNDRVKLVPLDRAVGSELIRSLFPPEMQDKITFNPHALRASGTHLMVPRDPKFATQSTLLLKEFNRGLRIIKKNGTVDRILADLLAGKYRIEDTKWAAN